jgi:hypothetical protein
MVNVGLSWSSFLGIALAIAGAALYFLRSMRPKLARDYDIFFAAVALLCGGILFFQGWRQDPILQFGQFLLTGSAIFFVVENIRLRGIATEQARRSSPVVDEERPVSRVYRAELDELTAFEDRTATRRIRGSRDARPSRDEYEEGVRRRPASRGPGEDRLGPTSDRSSRKRRPRPAEEGSLDNQEFQEDGDLWEDRPSSRNRGGSASRPSNQPPSANRPKRPRPASDESQRPRDRDRDVSSDPAASEYVDYRPVDEDKEDDNWGDY